MIPSKLDEVLDQILQEDSRYAREAYSFIADALEFTMQLLKKPASGPERHISGQELLEGVGQFALRQYGPMAKEVLAHWGVHKCEDFGEIVFHLVDKGVFGKTEKDSRDDFKGGYDFDEVFVQPFSARKKSSSNRMESKENLRPAN